MNIPKEEEREIRRSIEIANENISNICGKRRNKEAADKILSELNL
jgi:hypothetical protein